MGINNNYPMVSEGDRVSASQWYNPIAEEVSRLSRAKRARKTRWLSNGCGNFSIPEDDDGILFYNGDGTQIPAYGVVLDNGVQAAGGPDFVPKVKRPDIYGCQTNVYVNNSSTVSGNDFGFAQTFEGRLIAAYDSTQGVTPAPGQLWGPVASSYLLNPYVGGFMVCGIYDSTNHWVLVVPQPMLMFYGKNATGVTINKGGSGAINVYNGNNLGSLSDSGSKLTAYSLLGNVPNGAFVQCEYASWTGSAGNWVMAEMDQCST